MVFTFGEETLVNLNRWVPVMHCANCCVVLKGFSFISTFAVTFRPDMHFTRIFPEAASLATSALVVTTSQNRSTLQIARQLRRVATVSASAERNVCQLVGMTAPRSLFRSACLSGLLVVRDMERHSP